MMKHLPASTHESSLRRVYLRHFSLRRVALLVLLLLVSATGAGHEAAAADSAGTDLYAVTVSNKLLFFNTAAPRNIIRSVQITGLQTGENILALEPRQRNGQLYAVGSTGRVYRLNSNTGAAEEINGSPIKPPPSGSEFSVAIDERRDQMRVVTDTGDGRLLSLVGEFGEVLAHISTTKLAYASDDPAAGQEPKVTGLAWTPGELNEANAVYYAIDAARSALVVERAPNLGTLRTIGQLNLALVPNAPASFDIGAAAYAALMPICFEGCPAPSGLFTIDLQTGRATLVDWIGGGEVVRAIGVAPARLFRFAQGFRETEEACTSIQVTVERTGDTSNAASVDYATTSDAPMPVLIASERSDYNAARGTLHFAPGESTKAITLLINEDSYNEKRDGFTSEGFRVRLSNPSGDYAIGGGQIEAVVVIIDDDDGGAVVNPIDETATFVCQQYHDFLNRDPDAEGGAFWRQNIDTCGTDARCIELKRIETSAAFFLSIEFQETSFFVYRAYQAAYGLGRVEPGQTTVPLTLEEFLRDARRVGEGVRIGQPDALARLEANKQSFIREFTSRAEFLARFPSGQPNEAESFVAALDANAGGVLSQAEREALVRDYSERGREAVLRQLVEDEDFKRLSSNRAFVLSQYFGYLRRNPDDAPDLNWEGFNFWLTKLNNHGGDFRRAEMVKAFITSGEYRARFGAQ